jgi:hypothetical protein
LVVELARIERDPDHRRGTDFAPLFDEPENPFPWMSEAMDLRKEKNVFETRVVDRTGAGWNGIDRVTIMEP